MSKQPTWLFWLMVSGIILLIIGGGLWYSTRPIEYEGVISPQSHFAGLDGQALYQANCAVCHGAALEGQPNWKIPDENGVLVAPPHDNSGHTWHHADSLLLKIMAEGGSMPTTAMPAYQTLLTPQEMRAILAFIKTYWGAEELSFQAQVTQNSME